MRSMRVQKNTITSMSTIYIPLLTDAELQMKYVKI
jgi:hypothetical protein